MCKLCSHNQPRPPFTVCALCPDSSCLAACGSIELKKGPRRRRCRRRVGFNEVLWGGEGARAVDIWNRLVHNPSVFCGLSGRKTGLGGKLKQGVGVYFSQR